MPRRRRKPLPQVMAELTWASWETIAHRSAMMATGTCSDREYRRMVAEKLRAAQRSGAALMTGSSHDLWLRLLRPWHGGATRNARRLSKRKIR